MVKKLLIFLTCCCALHNMLIEADGLDEKWDEHVPSMWEGMLGCHDLHDIEEHFPDAIARPMSPIEKQAYRVSGMGFGEHEPMHNNELTMIAD